MRSHRSALMFTAACLAALGYFAWHGLYGSRGTERLEAIGFEVVRLERALAMLEGERGKLERRVALLRPEGIDPDLLDEKAREMLGFVAEEDRIILVEGAGGRSPAGD